MLTGNTDETLAFLLHWKPTGPWLLTAIVPDGPIETVEHDNLESAKRWIAERQGSKNLYFSVNTPRAGLRKKAGKGDIITAVALHVDSDPEIGVELSKEQRRIERSLLEYDPPPSVIMFSGGGYQGYWLLDEPVLVNGHAEDIESRNRAIEADLNSGPGHCYNIDRIMRLPGTVNLPNGKKREQGRVADVARLVQADWELRYPLSRFAPAGPVKAASAGNGAASAEWPRAALPDRVKDVIRSGGDTPEWQADKSKAVFYVCCEMVRCGWTNEEGAAIIKDPKNAISVHVLKQHNVAAYAVKQMNNARTFVGSPDWDVNDEGDLAEYESTMHLAPRSNGHAEAASAAGGGNVVSLATEAAKRPPPRRPAPPGDPTMPPEFSDDALALRFSELHCDKLRYVAVWGKWMLWDGARWASEEILLAYDLARPVGREAAARSRKEVFRRALTSARTVNAIVSLARSDARHAMRTDRWDLDIHAINTPDGTWDAAGFREHRREDYITKVTAVPAGGECPKWNAFLMRVCGDDVELVAYLARVGGYCLTGSVVEHTMFFFYGTGANGKGVFINTLNAVWGDYAVVSPMDTFTDKKNENHPTELARLRGARLVTAQETEKGRAWAESKIKALTGGDKITARFMRADFFEFWPQFKLLIAGNNKPSLRGVDEAIKRRIHLVPFTVTIPEGERNVHLSDELKEEWGGILQWALDGLEEYLRIGLAPPQVVRKATEEYFMSEDDFGTWLGECCEVGVNLWCSSADLWNSWRVWAEQSHVRTGNRKTFAETLKSRGFEPKQSGGEGKPRGYEGVGLIYKFEGVYNEDNVGTASDGPPEGFDDPPPWPS